MLHSFLNCSTISNVEEVNYSQDIFADLEVDKFEAEQYDTSTEFNDDSASLLSASSRSTKKAKTSGSSSEYSLVESVEKEEPLQHKDTKVVLTDIMIARNESKPQPADSIDLFLQSIGHTIKQFPPRKISEVKLQIMEIVSDMEMALLDQANVTYLYGNVSKNEKTTEH